MRIELVNTTYVMLQEIESKEFKRNDVAKTYALALRSSAKTDWLKVNTAILRRWSPYALEYIKSRAWSGKCF